MIRTPLRPLARVLEARAKGENPDAIERENLRLRHEEMRDRALVGVFRLGGASPRVPGALAICGPGQVARSIASHLRVLTRSVRMFESENGPARPAQGGAQPVTSPAQPAAGDAQPAANPVRSAVGEPSPTGRSACAARNPACGACDRP